MSAVSHGAALPVLRRWLSEGWRGLIGWSAGLAAIVFMYLPLFPSMKTPEMAGLLDSLPPELVKTLGYNSIATGTGYTQATLFGLTGFFILTIAGVAWGAAYTGGAEESGRLELTLAHGVGRVQYALESAAALLVKLLVLGAMAFIFVLAVNTPAALELAVENLLAVTASWVGLGLFTASAAFAVGAATGRRSWAIGAGAGIAVGGYVLQAVANNNADLDWLRLLSPYAWAYAHTPLTDGFDWAGLAALWGGSALLIAIATVALSRRDILG